MSDTTQRDSHVNGEGKQTSNVAKRRNGVPNRGRDSIITGEQNSGDTRRPTEGDICRVVGHSSPDESGAARKSGRLREKGPTTYTAKGEIIRGGKRVNDDIHEQPFAKRVRYET